jgi:hypothetical protein
LGSPFFESSDNRLLQTVTRLVFPRGEKMVSLVDIQVFVDDIPKNWRVWAIVIGFVLILLGMGSNSVPTQWFGGIVILLGVLPADTVSKIVDSIRRA